MGVGGTLSTDVTMATREGLGTDGDLAWLPWRSHQTGMKGSLLCQMWFWVIVWPTTGAVTGRETETNTEKNSPAFHDRG